MQYFGVIGNRDYIKHQGVKKPFWEFLDVQPDGWLSSLTYKRKDVPHGKQMIWDCGAWSYKNFDVPPVTPQSVLGLYEEYAPDGSFVIAPDHMLIDGVDLDSRRKFNRRSAEEFIDICPERFIPMGCIHGQTIEERLRHAEILMGLGYTHLAIGGVAARAAQKKVAFAIVAALREVTVGTWLHVLGLSSPEYAARWTQMRIDSFDGSSHFKQAFTAGAFFTVVGQRLVKFQAARPGEQISAPSCNCLACSMLRDDGIDTRMYGSNETNMGRAAHNMNMLMIAQAAAIKNPDAYLWDNQGELFI